MPPRKRRAQEAEAADEESEPSSSSAAETSGSGGSGSGGDSSSSDGGGSGGSDGFPEVSTTEEESDDSQGSELKELTVQFEFFAPEEKDFLGLKALLAPYLNGQEFESSALIDAIIAEGDVGSVVKTDSDDDPIALMAVLSTHKYKAARFMQQIRQFLLDQCPKPAAAGGAKLAEHLQQAFDAADTGLILNDRLINAPPKLSPPLTMFLMDAIKQRAQPGQPGAEHFTFQRFLLATRVYMDKGSCTRSGSLAASRAAAGPGSGAGPSTARPAKKQKQQEEAADPSQQQPEIIFSRPEDEYFHQHCAWWFTFPVESRPVGADGLQQCRLVMQVNTDQVPLAQQLLDEVVGNMAKGDGAGPSTAHAAEAAAAAGAQPRRQKKKPVKATAIKL